LFLIVYKWAVGWLSEGELHLPNVPLILRSDFTHGAARLDYWLRLFSGGYLQPQQVA